VHGQGVVGRPQLRVRASQLDGEAQPLVEADGGAVRAVDPQDQAPCAPGPRPVGDRVDQRPTDASPAGRISDPDEKIMQSSGGRRRPMARPTGSAASATLARSSASSARNQARRSPSLAARARATYSASSRAFASATVSPKASGSSARARRRSAFSCGPSSGPMRRTARRSSATSPPVHDMSPLPIVE
jgi:hypothetical protein